MKVPKIPVHLFVKGDWQARSGVSQLAYLDENTTTTCGQSCHFTSQHRRRATSGDASWKDMKLEVN